MNISPAVKIKLLLWFTTATITPLHLHLIQIECCVLSVCAASDVTESFLLSQSHKRLEPESSQSHKPLESKSSQSHLKFFIVESESWLGRVRIESRELSSHFESLVCKFESHEILHFFHNIFCYKMAPDKLENSSQCCFNKFDCRLFISKFIEIAFFLSLSLSVISKSLAQPWCKCYSLSVSIVLNVRFTTNGLFMMNNTHAVRTSRNRMITTYDIHCCLVQQWEALCTCYSAFPITTKWCFDQDVKVVPGATFTKRTCSRCGSLQKRGDVVGTFQLALHWKCGFHMLNTWKWPDMNMYLYLNVAKFQYIDGFGCYHFWLNRIELEFIFSFELLRNFHFSFAIADYCNFQFSFGTAGYCWLQVNCGLQPPTRWEPFVASTMLSRPEPTKERVQSTILSTIAIEITHLTRFAIRFLLRILCYMWRNHVATWIKANNSSRNLDLKQDSVLAFALCLAIEFWIGFEPEKLKSLYWYLEKTQCHSMRSTAMITICKFYIKPRQVVNILCPYWPLSESKVSVCLYTSLGHLILKMQHSN